MRLTLAIPFSKTAAVNELQRRTNPRWYDTRQAQLTVRPLHCPEAGILRHQKLTHHSVPPMSATPFVIVPLTINLRTFISFDLRAQARSKTINDRLGHSPLPRTSLGSAHSFERRLSPP